MRELIRLIIGQTRDELGVHVARGGRHVTISICSRRTRRSPRCRMSGSETGVVVATHQNGT